MHFFLRKTNLFLFCIYLSLLIIMSGCGTAGPSPTTLAAPTPVPWGEKSIKVTPTPGPCTQAVCLNPSTVPGVRPFIDTWNNIHIFQTFDFYYRSYQISQYAKSFDMVWGAGQEQSYTPALWRRYNPNIILPYYIPLNRDGGTIADPGIGGLVGRINYWKANHPDWVLYQCDRTTPVTQFGNPNIALDISNPAVQDWQMQTYMQPISQSGYDAIGIDNVNMNLPGGESGDTQKMACGHYDKNGQWVQRYSGQTNDTQWRTDVLAWLTTMQKRVHALPHPLALVINLGMAPLTGSDPFLQQIANHVDGILDESGFTGYGNQYVTDDAWVQLVQFIKSVQAHNKPYFIIDEFKYAPGQGITNDQVQWALSTYLMGKYHLSAVNPVAIQDYGSPRPRDEYNAPIGVPVSEMYQNQYVYWRNYSNGLVLVNPSSSSSFTVTLDSPHYTDLYGKAVGQTLTLQPQSGIVLLNKK